MLNSIAIAKPALGAIVSADNNAVGIAHTSADRPFILGSAVTNLVPVNDKASPLSVVGAGATIQGIMCQGISGIVTRGFFIKEDYDKTWNNVGIRGTFWGALDLKNFNGADYADLINTKSFILSVDANGVFSISKTAVANNTAVTNAKVLGVYSGIVQEAIDESIVVGGNTYTFTYPNGIGAICIAL